MEEGQSTKKRLSEHHSNEQGLHFGHSTISRVSASRRSVSSACTLFPRSSPELERTSASPASPKKLPLSSSAASRQSRPPSLRLLCFVFCCGLFAALSSVLGKLALDFHAQAPLSRASLIVVDLFSSLSRGPTSTICLSQDRAAAELDFKAPNRREDNKGRPPERAAEPLSDVSFGDEKPHTHACSQSLEQDAPSVSLPSSLLSLLQAVGTNCVHGSCVAGAADRSFVESDETLGLPSLYSHSFFASLFASPCEGAVRLPCGLLLLLASLRAGALLLMVLSNTLLLHCQFQALFEASTAFVPSVLTFVFNFLLSGLFSLLVFQEAVSARWLAGAGAMLTGVGLLMSGDKGRRQAPRDQGASKKVA